MHLKVSKQMKISPSSWGCLISHLWQVCLRLGAEFLRGEGKKGVFLTINRGATWSAARFGLTNIRITVLALATVAGLKGRTIAFAGTEGGGVFFSTNDGSIWADINSNLPDLNMRSLGIALLSAGSSSLTLFARTHLRPT
jgi:hypothetical protein